MFVSADCPPACRCRHWFVDVEASVGLQFPTKERGSAPSLLAPASLLTNGPDTSRSTSPRHRAVVSNSLVLSPLQSSVPPHTYRISPTSCGIPRWGRLDTRLDPS